MRCLGCGRFCLRLLCATCQNILSSYTLKSRLVDELEVFYFYAYSEISALLGTKHKLCGSGVFKALCQLSISRFAQSFYLPDVPLIHAIALDDNVKSGYSHSAIIAKALKNAQISPLPNALKAMSEVKYAGKSLEYRQKNPRNFKLLKPLKAPVILVDDIITTGLSMKEAKECVENDGGEVLFGTVLADARE